jgi:succinyl-diaminopimelate desuccinylase
VDRFDSNGKSSAFGYAEGHRGARRPAFRPTDPRHHADHCRREVRELRRAAQRQGYPGGLLYKHGAGDAGFYPGRGIAAVAFGVGGAGQHGPDEYVEVATIVPRYRALKECLEHLRWAADG